MIATLGRVGPYPGVDMGRAETELVDWWNGRAEWIEARIASSTDPKDTVFYWSQLVWQELNMWRIIGEGVDTAELDFIANRRGFTAEQVVFLEAGLAFLGLRMESV